MASDPRAAALARRVLDLAKASLLADNHFLAPAVGRLEVLDAEGLQHGMATDGYALYLDAAQMLEGFRQTGGAPTHDLMHSVAHCIFLHPYVAPTVNRDMWDLACDIAAERTVVEVIGQRDSEQGQKVQEALAYIEKSLGCRLTAEKVYHRLCDGDWASKVPGWTELFAADDHAPWWQQQGEGDETYVLQSDGPAKGSSGSSGGNSPADSRQGDGPSTGESQGNGTPGEGDQNESSSGDDGQVDDTSNSGDQTASSASPENSSNGKGMADDTPSSNGQAGSSSADAGQENGSSHDGSHIAQDARRSQVGGAGSLAYGYRSSTAGMDLLPAKQPSREQQASEWRDVASALAVNLQTYAKARGQELGGLVCELEQVSHQPVDYTDFLRQFAVPGEVMKLSEDEFDYLFYTYGLSLYGDVALIEPLEYREEKRIREFAIAIDTSGSVQGELVRAFVDATFDILKSTESFHTKVHVRILQCDEEICTEDVITSIEELGEWGRTMQIHGGGGTDFRPVFAHVDKLIEAGELTNMVGLVYFTDGWGDYPEKMPAYRTAFAFYDEDYRPDCVPPWAVQVVLDSAALQAAHDATRG